MNRRACSVLLATTIVLSACSGGDAAGVTTEVAATTTTTISPTTSSSTTTSSTTSTSSTTTTTEPLPVPIAPPPPRADEPLVELGTIEIPKIRVSKKLYEGITMNTLDRGPGHWPGTAMPGRRGNVVVAGHRTSHDHPFLEIDKLVAGDQVIFNTADGRFTYKVTGTKIVNPTDVWIVDQTPGYTATLFACHPLHSTRQRIVVFLDLVTT